MTVEDPRPPRPWVFWMVVASLALTVVALGVARFGFGRITSDSFWWLIFGLPQVSIALLAAILYWTPDSRPPGFRLSLGIHTLNLQGLMFLLSHLKWQPAIIGGLTLITLKFWPKEKVSFPQEEIVIEQTPPAEQQL